MSELKSEELSLTLFPLRIAITKYIENNPRLKNLLDEQIFTNNAWNDGISFSQPKYKEIVVFCDQDIWSNKLPSMHLWINWAYVHMKFQTGSLHQELIFVLCNLYTRIIKQNNY